MDKEGFDASSSMLKDFMEICVRYKESKPKASEKTNTACKSHSKRGGKRKAKCKASKRLAVIGDKILYNIIPMAEDISIASTMGIATTCQMSAESP
eukprot:7466997-Ditylum_brightwellii.AAC.1